MYVKDCNAWSLKFLSCCNRHKMLIGESNIASDLLIFLNILTISRDWDWLFYWCTDCFGNFNVREYWPLAASCKSSPNLKHCKEIYFRGNVMFSPCCVIKKVFMFLCSSFSCISSYGSTQVELLTLNYWDIDFGDVQGIASLKLYFSFEIESHFKSEYWQLSS